RRQLLKFIAGTPAFLPLGAATTAMLAACGSGSDDDDDDESTPVPTPQVKSARFVGMPAPAASGPAELATTSVKSELVLELTDGSTVNYKLAYQPFFMTGDMVPDGNGGEILAGGYYDINNQPLMDTS